MRSFMLGLAMALVASLPAFAQSPTGCDWTHGGFIPACEAMANRLPQGHRVPAGVHYSAATYILNKAGCIHSGASFGFHSSHDQMQGGNLVPSDDQRRYVSRWPRLLAHLDAVGAFHRYIPTMIGSAQASELTGIPICR